MGYTVKTTTDMVALGVSAIGNVQGAFVQNTKKLPEYYAAVAAGRFPIDRGYALDQDDEIRRHVITELMCNFRLDVPAVERRFGISFAEYFHDELAALTAPADSPVADGLVSVHPRSHRRSSSRPHVRPQHLHGVRQVPGATHRRTEARVQPHGMTPRTRRRRRRRHHRPRRGVYVARRGGPARPRH